MDCKKNLMRVKSRLWSDSFGLACPAAKNFRDIDGLDHGTAHSVNNVRRFMGTACAITEIAGISAGLDPQDSERPSGTPRMCPESICGRHVPPRCRELLCEGPCVQRRLHTAAAPLRANYSRP